LTLNKNQNILICPLEWGLGHAGRMVPLARRLLELNQNIFFGAGHRHLSFLKSEVPGATCIDFPGFRIKYSRFFPQYIIILLKSPLLLYHIFQEYRLLKRIIKDYQIDIVISDSRIGLWNRGVKTVFVTHQLRIAIPKPFRFLEFSGMGLSRVVIKKYSFCFIPDLEGGMNLSGKLSHGFNLPVNTRYIGILSRLSGNENMIHAHSGKCTAILSGPEPQRSILKNKLVKIFLSLGKPSAILEGKPENGVGSDSLNNIVFYNHLPENETIKLLYESDIIVTRSGYTTIMELVSLGLSALLIPTPGQTEQEYLAEYLVQKGWFTSVTQRDLNKKHIVPSALVKVADGIIEESRRLLDKALMELLG
jgi:spore coat polysaccharide biosynthesis predicted glycosyltransferase SpsG